MRTNIGEIYIWVSIFLIAACLTCLNALHCPNLTKCQCNEDLTTVNCMHAQLSSIPNLPETTKHFLMDYNDLTTIPSNAFSNVPRLQSFSVTNNEINTILPLAFDGLDRFSEIHLERNKIQVLLNRSFASVPNLRYLDLSWNLVSDIDDDAFVGSSEISEIVLYHNWLSNVPSVGYQPQLSVLNLSENLIIDATFPPSYRNSFKNLSIDLSHNYLYLKMLDNSSFSSLAGSTLFDMTLAYNKLESLGSDIFNGIRVIKKLDLRYNHLSDSSFSNKTFTGANVLAMKLEGNSYTKFPRNLPLSLEFLDLSTNQIQVFRSKEISYLENLKTLLLANNRITSFGFMGPLNNMNVLDLSMNKISSLYQNLSEPLKDLTHLYLGHNNLLRLDSSIFYSFTSLRVLDLSDNRRLDIPVDIFERQTSLRVLHLERNDLGRIFGDTKYEQLFRGVDKLEELYISNNSIKALSDSIFHDQISLKILKADKNQLSGWGPTLFKFTKHLEKLDVSLNSISVLYESNLHDVENLNGLEINLTGNPFDCSCDLLWFRNWMDRTTVDLTSKETYQCQRPETWSGKLLLDFKKDKIDCYSSSNYIIVGPVLAILLVCVAFGIFVYKYRWRIRLRIYLTSKHGRAVIRNVRIQQANYGAMNGDSQRIYDAYILSSEDDEDWVLHHLLPDIDNGRYDDDIIFGGDFKLYYDPRDLDPGISQVANIFEQMTRSRKVIVILTNHYLNGVKDFALDQAITLYHDHKLEDIIVVKVGDVPVRRIPQNLYSYIRNRTFIEWKDNAAAIRTFKKQIRERLLGN